MLTGSDPAVCGLRRRFDELLFGYICKVVTACWQGSAESIVIACIADGWIAASLTPASEPKQHKTTEPARKAGLPVAWNVRRVAEQHRSGRDSGHRAERADVVPRVQSREQII